MLNKEYFIPHNTPSSKNSKQATSKGVFHSATVRKYLQKLGVQHYSPSKKTVKEYKTKPNLFRAIFNDFQKPDTIVYICMHFVRDSRRKFDYINAMQIVLDLLTAHDLIEDDNCDYVVPVVEPRDNKFYTLDKENAGVYVTFKEVKL